ncbi:carbohydrate binding domain-containing protein [Saccharothrix obliqua]|uniref:carbohydrate binding domain-containing protein n=1 Tax=Saccharothrix obliqua TaxID=2861747 RepID=UPI001C60559D|nr:carbohydrate binding domain-containing protein [Saccharothrix obliqua]MBW4718553.1 carbohydrate binding domain-containing protein [Saccharothrix obliqua]
MRSSRVLVLLVALFTSAALMPTAAHAAAKPLPAHVFAPYFEAWTGENPATLAQQSGAKYLTFAFLQTATKGSCTPLWSGDPGMPVSSSVFGADINALRANGGDAIPSFGGYTADNTGTEIADSCTDVAKIAAAFQSVITTYDVTRLDLDIEDNSLTNTAGIDRRNKAIKMTEDWAAANGRTVQFSYTLPTTPHGLAPSGLAVLRNAVTNNARIDVVNMMTFDYYDGATHQMADDTKTAAQGLVDQLAQLYPGKTQQQLWSMVGITEMIGVDDYGPAETFQLADARTVYDWAVAKGINTLSFWALQRDNGNCPGGSAADNCSGIAQQTWEFTHIFAPFSGDGNPNPDNDFSLAVNPASATVDPGASTTATVGTAVTAGNAQTIALTAGPARTGLTAALSPTSVTAGGSSTLTVSAAANATPGDYQFTITGTSSSATHTATFSVKVKGTPPTGVIANAGFEDGGLAPWTGAGDTVVGSPTHSGTHALQVAPSGNGNGQASQTVTLAPNKAYTLKAWVRGNYAFIGVSGGATASAWTSAADWTQLSVPFTTGASGTVTVYVHGWYGQAPIHADDFTIS